MRRDIEELTDILAANNFGYGHGKQFHSHRVVIVEKDEDHWLLYGKSEGTLAALTKLFRTDWDVHVSDHVLGDAVAYNAETRVDL